jgi:fluoride ion exporter CrcB/FEX
MAGPFKNPYILYVFFGAIVLTIYSETRAAGARLWLKTMFPTRSDQWHKWGAFFIDVIVGTFFGLLFYAPKTELEGVFAGLGWVGALHTLIRPAIKGPEQTEGTKPTRKRGS